ncbi:MAG: hypothetical protein U0Q22_13650 [Acidimicrobiales bacterium]
MSREPFRWSASVNLGSPAAAVWAVVSTPAGVNEELDPYVRMTFPRSVEELTSAEITPGVVVTRSWVLAGGVVPFDRHSLAFESIDDEPGASELGFVEESTSWLERRWRHERRVVETGVESCELTDTLTVVPRLPFTMPMVRRVVPKVFENRHRQLVERWGSA